MGTNFYCKHIPTEEEYKEMEIKLKERRLASLEDKIKETKKVYHIGKRSIGWAFGFQAPTVEKWDSDEAKVPWNANIDSLRDYLNSPNLLIYNEYGDEFTPEEFWKEIEDCIHVDDSHFWQETYYKAHPEESFYKDNSERLINNTRWINRWFC